MAADAGKPAAAGAAAADPPPTLLATGGMLAPQLARLLRDVQAARLFADSKTAVDLVLASSPDDVAAAYDRLLLSTRDGAAAAAAAAAAGQQPPPDVERLRAFVAEHLRPAGSDLEPCTPPDWRPEGPDDGGFLPALAAAARAAEARGDAAAAAEAARLRAFGLRVHGLWARLARRAAPGVAAHPERHSLLPLQPPHSPPLFVVPGDRFRECYYWDSLWAVKGLVASGMRGTAAALVGNLLWLGAARGFVPNGARGYYLNRSQPPLLSVMVRELHAAHVAAGDGAAAAALLREALLVLRLEHRYWTAPPKGLLLVLDDDGGAAAGCAAEQQQQQRRRAYRLSRYRAAWDAPRPESSREDEALAEAAAAVTGAAASGGGRASSSSSSRQDQEQQRRRRRLFTELATAAESGWDFSSRWFAADGQGDGGDSTGRAAAAAQGASRLAATRATRVVPADLNAFLYLLEANTAWAARELLLVKQQQQQQQQHDGEAATAAAGSGGGGGDDAASGCDDLAGVAAEFEAHAAARREAMTALLWDEAAAMWRDGVLLDENDEDEGKGLLGPGGSGDGGGSDTSAPPPRVRRLARSRRVFASNFLPLWADGLVPGGGGDGGDGGGARVVAALEASGLVGPSGVAASLARTGEQWDAPNAWPPLQHALVEAAARHGGARGARFARRLARRWLLAACAGLEATGHMHEKYDASAQPGDGRPGGGGEYAPQVGFGWTNGAALDLLANHYHYHPRSSGTSSSSDDDDDGGG